MKKIKQTCRHDFISEVSQTHPNTPPTAHHSGGRDLRAAKPSPAGSRCIVSVARTTNTGTNTKFWLLITGFSTTGNKAQLKGGLTDTFFRHSSQLLLVQAQGPAIIGQGHKAENTPVNTTKVC